MIIIYHQHNKVVSIWDKSKEELIEATSFSIAENLLSVAKSFPSSLLIWCHISQKGNLNFDGISEVFHHRKIMASFNVGTSYLPKNIGYVEETPFIKINKEVQYPTWQMSSCVGGIFSEVLNRVVDKPIHDFDYFLTSIAKRSMPAGLFCYSAPGLLVDKKNNFDAPAASVYDLFRFVKEHYKAHWCLLLLVNLLLYKKQFRFLPLLYASLYKNKMNINVNLDTIEVHSSKNVIEEGTVDVIIPTIGRKKYLYDFLNDLVHQSIVPKNVIIVEQNTLPESITELDYITKENWPFTIKHTFTHQAGACNARNIALGQVESETVFFADDDIRIESNFIEDTIALQKKYGLDAVMLSCLLVGQTNNYTTISQTTIFGSGCSMVKYNGIKTLFFDNKLEFGYGEDFEFGMQMRNLGIDILYLPNPRIIHLKAPIGGFRTKHSNKWDNDAVSPKPSPTVMYVKLKSLTKEQLLGYKLVLFFKLHGVNLLQISSYRKKWSRSIYWANFLKDHD